MNFRTRSTLAAALALALLPFAASAGDLPKARTLIDAHLKAVGGAKAFAKADEGTIKATMEIVEAGMKGDMTVYARGTDMTMTLTLPNYGETRMGTIGGTTWSIDPQNGPRLLQGKEREQFLQQNDRKHAARDQSLIAKAETTALSDSEGRACYRVEIEWKSGEKTADCYGVDDSLLLSTESTAATPMGEIKQITHMYDYKAMGAIKAPYKAKTKLAGMTQIILMQSFDETKLADSVFEMPPSIAALLKKQAEAADMSTAK
ncbi:MAG: hypothetical protein KA144_04185 [Xanthomonadaceae bacterium]|nr:hypothetical protein [Xanthomonadaceae bacterium]